MSSNLDECQLLITPPSGGAWNMAVDEVLLGEVAKTGTPTLRFYSWKRPTLSLGYFQRADDRSQHPTSTSVDLVRRLSGGGAILHDRELTYSLILPATHTLAGDTRSLYRRVHQTIVSTLNTLLANAESTRRAALCESAAGHSHAEEPFLCFMRRTSGDILLTEKHSIAETPMPKVGGSAQRRRRGTVLQHGSILVQKSMWAPELMGLADHLQSKDSIGTDLLTHLASELPQQLGFQPTNLDWTAQLTAEAGELERSKYQAPGWTERR